MQALRIKDYGGKDVIYIDAHTPKPAAGAGQILVEVHAASVNPFDISVREGRVRKMAELDFPATLGGDLSGTVVDLGEGVEGLSIGQAVYGQAGALSGQGSFAEYSPVKASQLASKPSTLDFTQAASLPLAGVSAYQALVDHIGLGHGRKILIHGGAGGIGSLAVQIARHIGAHIAVTASSRDADSVKGLGADEVIDYETQDFTTIIKGYDAVFDTVGGDTNAKSYGVLKPGGILVSMAAPPDEQAAQRQDIRYIHQFTQVTTERLEALARLVDDGSIKPVVDKVFPLDQAAEAMEYLRTGHPRGKVVIRIKG